MTLHRLLPFLLVALVGGCKSDTVGLIDEGAGFTLSISTGVLTLTQGASGSITVSVTRSVGFAAPVTIAVEGLPTGVTVGPLTIAGGAGPDNGTLTFSAALDALVGNETVIVRAVAAGADGVSANLLLVVNSATAPGFALSVAPAQLTVQAGSSAPATVSLTRSSGFTGGVTLSALNLPAGVTAEFTPAAPTGSSAALTLTAAPGAAATGPTQVTVQGAATGLPNQMAQLSLTVETPPEPNLVVVDFCEVTGVPLWVAYQDGTGGWSRATGAGPSYTFLTTLARMLIRRGVDTGPGNMVGAIDFQGVHAFDPELPSLTLVGVGGNETVVQTTEVRTDRGAGLVARASLIQNNWYGVPEARLEPNELQLLTVRTENFQPPFPTRSVVRMLRAPEVLTLTLGPMLHVPAVQAVAATGHARAQAVLETQSEYDRLWTADFRQTEPGSTRRVRLQITRGYRGSDPAPVTLLIPDFTPVTGWTSDLGAPPGHRSLLDCGGVRVDDVRGDHRAPPG